MFCTLLFIRISKGLKICCYLKWCILLLQCTASVPAHYVATATACNSVTWMILIFLECRVLVLCAADIPEEEARYWAKKLEQLNAMKDQDVRSKFYTICNRLSIFFFLSSLAQHVPLVYFLPTSFFVFHTLSNCTPRLPITTDLPD